MDLDALYKMLAETTQQFRKGEVLEGTPEMVAWAKKGDLEEPAPGGVLEIYDMAPASAASHLETVDVHYVVIGVDREKAEERRAQFMAFLREYPDPDRLAAGPSYIEVGALIGDQGAAFQLFALGKVLGVWDVITPEQLGISGSLAEQMAGSGYIMCTGYWAS